VVDVEAIVGGGLFQAGAGGGGEGHGGLAGGAAGGV
jgi:hypothetical protein